VSKSKKVNCQKVVKKLSKNGQKVAKSCKKSCQKLSKSIIGHFMCHGKLFKRKIQQTVVGGGGGRVGGEIVVPRPSASASLTGQRQKCETLCYYTKYMVVGWRLVRRLLELTFCKTGWLKTCLSAAVDELPGFTFSYNTKMHPCTAHSASSQPMQLCTV
jgi:hypothetical protein